TPDLTIPLLDSHGSFADGPDHEGGDSRVMVERLGMVEMVEPELSIEQWALILVGWGEPNVG
ncbi:MAG: hypothetical protein ACKN9W_20380, partial [Methylococcus sp.]